MHSRTVNVCVAVFAILALGSPAAFGQFNLIDGGAAGDSVPDLVYDSTTGNITLNADGGANIGLFQLLSTSSVFTGDAATLPNDGLFPVDTDMEIAKAAFTAVASVNLGNVAPAGLDAAFLVQDINTAYVSAGFGFDNITLELICANCGGGGNTPPVGTDGVGTGFKGTTFNFQFDAVDVEDDLSGTPLSWSNLIFNSGPGGATPTNAPSLGADGAFSWAIEAGPVNDPQGAYSWTATVTDSGGLSDTATLRVDVTIPEPASALLVGLAVAGLAFIRRR